MSKFKNIHDCEKDLNDFLHTAYFINKMDVIFTVDTSLVHLAGTLEQKNLFISSTSSGLSMGTKKQTRVVSRGQSFKTEKN